MTEYSATKKEKKVESNGSDNKRSTKEMASAEVGNFAKSIFLARLEGIASIADVVSGFVSDVKQEQDESISTTESVGEFIRSVPDGIRPGLKKAKKTSIEIPGKMLDKFYHEFREKRTESKKETAE